MNNASIDMIKGRIKESEKKIEDWSNEVNRLREKIAVFDRWINFEQADLDDAREMLNKIEPCEGIDEEGNETYG